MSALVVGSMIPDFQYFIRMKLSGRFSHTLAGIFLFDLPVAILVLIIFHAVVKKQLVNNLPSYLQSRLISLRDFDFWQYMKQHPVGLIVCILIGTASHIVWDGFTHKDGLFTELIPGLLTNISINGLPELPLYRYLQHISTLVGALLIFSVFHRMPVVQNQSKPDLRFWTALTFFFVLTFIIRSYFGIGYYGDTVVILISSGFVGLILASAITRIKWNKT